MSHVLLIMSVMLLIFVMTKMAAKIFVMATVILRMKTKMIVLMINRRSQ